MTSYSIVPQTRVISFAPRIRLTSFVHDAPLRTWEQFDEQAMPAYFVRAAAEFRKKFDHFINLSEEQTTEDFARMEAMFESLMQARRLIAELRAV